MFSSQLSYGRSAHAHYETALVCENGHLITTRLDVSSDRAVPFCKECGARTISACPACSAPIHGAYDVPGVLTTKSGYKRATYCYSCSARMPWTTRALVAATEWAAELDALTDDDRMALQKAFPDLLADTPMTTVAAGRFKRLMVKVGSGAAETFHDLLVDVLSEAAKKAIWG